MNDRYSRQTLFTPIGEQGQQRLAEKHVLIIGAGALGTGNAESLVRAGVGKITIVDRDYVEWSNLQRQQLHVRSEEHTSELQSRGHLVCRLLLEKKNKTNDGMR